MKIEVINKRSGRSVEVSIEGGGPHGVRERVFLAAKIAPMLEFLRDGVEIKAWYNPHFDRWKTEVWSFVVECEATESLARLRSANCEWRDGISALCERCSATLSGERVHPVYENLCYACGELDDLIDAQVEDTNHSRKEAVKR